MTDVPHIITSLSLGRLSADDVAAEKAAGRPHPERCPIGPFRDREAAEEYADRAIRTWGGEGSAEFAPLRDDLVPPHMRPPPFEPPGLRDIVKRTAYKPGWTLSLSLFAEGGEPRCWALHIVSDTADSYDHSKPMRVRHEFLVPPASYNRDTWIAWVFDRIRQVEDHEAGEFFMVDGVDGVDGVRVFAPHHGNGEDPYRVWFVGDYADTRVKAGQDKPVEPVIWGEGHGPCPRCGLLPAAHLDAERSGAVGHGWGTSA